MNDSVSDASIGDRLMEFYGDSTGNIFYNISGFSISQKYFIKRNGSWMGNYVSNSTGWLSFVETDNGNHSMNFITMELLVFLGN